MAFLVYLIFHHLGLPDFYTECVKPSVCIVPILPENLRESDLREFQIAVNRWQLGFMSGRYWARTNDLHDVNV